MITHLCRQHKTQGGGALTETLVAMLAFIPFAIGVPLLGKQLDIKEKSIDATRYSVWERTVWRSSGNNSKTADDILVEVRDRIMGNARAGVLSVGNLRTQGITENVMWIDHAGNRLLASTQNDGQSVAVSDKMEASPKDVGWLNVPGAAYGKGSVFSVFKVLGWKDMGFDPNSFVRGDVTIRLRSELEQLAQQSRTLGPRTGASNLLPSLEQQAHGGILSDTWAAKEESSYRGRIDRLTADEGIILAETPGISVGAFGPKGNALYGEGRYGWGKGLGKGPDPSAPSNVLPSAYIKEQQ